jgi:hypothetical protein
MIHPNLTEWPIQGAGHALPLPRGGVAPLRHDLALTTYLERQAAQRASSSNGRDGWRAALRSCERLVQAGRTKLRSLRAPMLERRRGWAR